MDFPEFEVVDLTHPLNDRIPTPDGVKPFKLAKEKKPKDSPDELTRYTVTLGDHLGTHVDAASCLDDEGRTVDRVPASQLVLPAVMVDVRERTIDNPGYRFTVADFFDWEEEHGWIPPYSAILLHTGWGFRWHTPESYLGSDQLGTMHFPGYGSDVAEFLAEERSALALGIDTASVDVGRSSTRPVHKAMLERNILLVENLANLHTLPERGFLVAIGALPLKGAGGAPARVMAVVPKR